MKLVFDTVTPIQQLEYASEGLSDVLNMGVSTSANWAAKLKKALPEVVQGFFGVRSTLEVPKDAVVKLSEYKLARNQTKFLKIVNEVPYADFRDMRAYVPVGLSITYLEILDILLPAAQRSVSCRGKVVEPYMMLLAKLVSDKNGTVATVDHTNEYKNLATGRKVFEKKLVNAYSNGQRDQTTIRKVIDRNADWKEVFQKINTVSEMLQTLDLDATQKQLVQCGEYLDILCQRFANGEVSDATRETAQGLAMGAFEVANEMEFISKVYFLCLTLSKSINDTVDFVNSNLG